jgi:hypothetical protein
MIGLENIRGMDLRDWFPSVITFGVSLPFDEVLKGSRPPMTSVADDALNLIFFFAINQIWRWA